MRATLSDLASHLSFEELHFSSNEVPKAEKDKERKARKEWLCEEASFLFFVLLLNHYGHPKNEGNARNSQLLQSIIPIHSV